MYLSDHDLKQINEDGLRRLPADPLLGLSVKLLADLKEARDRLNRTPQNSSKPPSTQAPWERVDSAKGEEVIENVVADCPDPPLEPLAAAVKDEPQNPSESCGDTKKEVRPPKGRSGRPLGAPGVSRTQQLPITSEQIHRPDQCAVCGASLAGTKERAYTARQEIDVVPPSNGMPGLVVTQTKHIYSECQCGCGHWTRAEPGRANPQEGWTVELTEWHLVGPMLVALICSLALRMRLSRARIKELLHDWLGLELGVATINQCVHEAGRAVEPVVQNEILEMVRQADVLNVDETVWFEGKQQLWLWVFTCATVVLFVVGKRTRQLVVRILTADFEGWLMSDGYAAYRNFDQRLRCLVHIIRKARGLVESLDQRAQCLGMLALGLIEDIIESVYQARSSPPDIPLRERYSQRLTELFHACVGYANSEHAKARAFARELLNDWDTFWVVLDHPELPLTNNEAERALRHWVIARRISHGTRTGQGTYAFFLLASVIETCRKRKASPWAYIAEVVRLQRTGLPVPALPVVAG